jgi:hypothetical protein
LRAVAGAAVDRERTAVPDDARRRSRAWEDGGGGLVEPTASSRRPASPIRSGTRCRRAARRRSR